ncbi:MAG: putative hydro-lyase [Pirellulales bacterium]
MMAMAGKHPPDPRSLHLQDLPRASASELRRHIREQRFDRPTAGLAVGYAQANVVILPADVADEFAEFCRLNAQACPLIDRTAPGDFHPKVAAPQADLRTDIPRYRVFRHGEAEPEEPREIKHLWRDDSVGFLLGCSFTFEYALVAAGLEVRHIEQGRNVPMYRTNRPCITAGRFAGPLVVSMRPFRNADVPRVIEISSRFPRMHGAPVHVGDPAALGIADLARPEFGESVRVADDEVPVFWACGVTPQEALRQAAVPLCITHSPGCMFVTDLRDEDFDEG